MTTSKTIAALLGPTLVASALSLLANLGTSRTIIEGLSQSPALIMIAGYAAFVPGLAIVYFHNRWTGRWPVLVTVMGWLSLVVGLLRMVFPTQIAAMATKIAPAAAGIFPVFAESMPWWAIPWRRCNFPARPNKFPVRRELIPCSDF